MLTDFSQILTIINSSPPYLLSIVAGVCIVSAIIQAFRNKIKSGVLLAGLFFVSVVLVYFPQLDSIQAFAIDVRLRKSLDRAEEILDRLKALSVISAKSSYMAMAWNNRFGSPSATDKQALLDEVDKQLIALKVEPNVRVEISQPYVQMIGVDLFSIYYAVMERYVQWKDHDLQQKQNTTDGIATYQKYASDVDAWRKSSYPGPITDIKNYDLDGYLQKATPEAILTTEESKTASGFRHDLLKFFADCKAKGGYTAAAAEYVDEYGYGRGDVLAGTDRKMKELFGVSFAVAPSRQ